MYRNSRLNCIYQNMLSRCNNPDDISFQRYGGRGITVCPEWLNSEKAGVNGCSSKGWLAFKAWALGHGYSDKLTIDRIDTNKGYSPENCRWVDWETQCSNRRSNHFITYKGKTQTAKQWSKELGINYTTVMQRINQYHWSISRTFETAVRKAHRK